MKANKPDLATRAPSLSIADQKVEMHTRRFARQQQLKMDDPIIRIFRTGLKQAFAYRRRKNKLDADREQRQPRLFPRKEMLNGDEEWAG